MTGTAGGRDLVFVGGTGRSGTHILGRLLGSHARFADVPIESRFHCNKRGMPDLLWEGASPWAGSWRSCAASGGTACAWTTSPAASTT